MADEQQTQELERNLGLMAALAIGVGTMVGAGVFVFPGLAGGQAGVGAVLSFLIAGAIAMLVALCTAELSTAMPQSGGGYFFVSRTMGVAPGTLVGIGQTVGLVFASAFYVTGLADYAISLFAELGVDLGDPVLLIGIGVTVALLALNFFGTEKVGQAQNYIVAGLLVILLTLFGYGLLDVFGLVGEANLPEELAPEGWLAIGRTTALVFTSYLGFVQIATVAGEVTLPYRNLPKALIISVCVATGLYVLVLFITTSLYEAEELAEMSETATVEVARTLVGPTGAYAILFAGLLATLSSANASILSASRTLYALGSDKLIPTQAAELHEKFGTPYKALVVVGIPTVACLFIGRIKVLSEVASLLHLILYGLICVTLVLCRRRRPLWFAPTWRIPAYPLVPVLGAIACFGLIALMSWTSLGISAGIVALALLWYYVFDRDKSVDTPTPTHIAPALRRPHILLPVNLEPEGADDILTTQIVDAFTRLDLLVLGYRTIPDQTTPEQADANDDGNTEDRLGRFLDPLNLPNEEIDRRVIHTHDISDNLAQLVEDEDCQAVVFHRGLDNIDRILLPLRKPDALGRRLATILRDLVERQRRPITVLLFDRSEEASREDRNTIDRLLARAGIPRDELDLLTCDNDDLYACLEEHGREGDLVVMRESEDEDRQELLRHAHRNTERAILIVTEQAEATKA